MIRHEEEQLPVNQRGSITGRLGETHVLELFVHLRCVCKQAVSSRQLTYLLPPSLPPL